ncbi:HAD family hydrolase [Lederbergia sp. NSJ-179]|uniref:HAD family hydrolase n=1 Tax=Lederbergia sp. NSJ-179 TaxID=2931402 RepID=UPI001FD2E71F|nr:HAD family hydrolase [Lederbergia sp. NSJ-179]MCJ7842752.1 HAD family hydrolase [Lederbergia sp. NSJ-179]
MKKYITFDLDETLMQNPFRDWVFPEIESLVAPHLQVTDRILPEIIKEQRERVREKRDVAAYDWDDILEVVLAEHGIPIKINIADLVRKHSVDPKVFLLERNALTILGELKKRKFKLGGVTNGFYKYQYPVLEAIDLAEQMDTILTPCETGFAKPDIRLVDPLLKEGELIAHVGDRLDHDVYFANQLGALSILIDHQMPEVLKKIAPKKRAKQKGYLTKIFQRKIYDDLTPEENYIPKIIIHSIHELLEVELKRENLAVNP